MSNLTAYLPGFSHHLNGRARSSEAVKLKARSNSLDGLASLVARFVPVEIFEATYGRERVYSPWVTFVAFLGQVLSRGSACREAVRRVQAWRSSAKQSVPDESTSAYCQARARLDEECLRGAHNEITHWIDQHKGQEWLWCGRRAKVVDGCGVSMPDTEANRAVWPYAGGQKEG